MKYYKDKNNLYWGMSEQDTFEDVGIEEKDLVEVTEKEYMKNAKKFFEIDTGSMFEEKPLYESLEDANAVCNEIMKKTGEVLAVNEIIR